MQNRPPRRRLDPPGRGAAGLGLLFRPRPQRFLAYVLGALAPGVDSHQADIALNVAMQHIASVFPRLAPGRQSLYNHPMRAHPSAANV